MVEIDVVYEGELHAASTHEPSGAIVATDAPIDNQGRGESFSPTDLLAAAFGSCMLTVMGIGARREEAQLIRDKINTIPWLDNTMVILVGHSEGAVAAASYKRVGEFQAIIALAGECGKGVNSHTPTLSITAKKDVWYRQNNAAIKCGQYDSRNHQYIALPGGDHNLLLSDVYGFGTDTLTPEQKQARDAIEKILRDQGFSIETRG